MSPTRFRLSAVATLLLGVSMLAAAAYGKSGSAHPASVLPTPGPYSGSSSQAELIRLFVDTDRRHIVYTSIKARLSCPNRRRVRFTFTSITREHIRSNGTWREHASSTSTARHPFSLTISGMFVSRMRAHGTLSVRSTRPADGGVCSSGRVTWTARHFGLPLSTRAPASG
jgi:hypothetical protein